MRNPQMFASKHAKEGNSLGWAHGSHNLASLWLKGAFSTWISQIPVSVGCLPKFSLKGKHHNRTLQTYLGV